MSMNRMTSTPGNLSRKSSYFSASHSSTAPEGDPSYDDEAFFLSPRSKSQRESSESGPGYRPHTRQRTLSSISGMSGMSGFSESSTAGGMSDSWTSAGEETYVDPDFSNEKEKENLEDSVVSNLGLTRSISSALIVPASPSKMTRRAMSFDSRPAGSASMASSISMPASTPPLDLSIEKPSLSTLLAHLDPGTRTTSAYVSASMSFFYALWEAVRRYRVNVKHDVEIAIMDAQEFVPEADADDQDESRRVWTVGEMMEKKDPEKYVCKLLF